MVIVVMAEGGKMELEEDDMMGVEEGKTNGKR
jgi:hypothetical protein